MESRYPFPREEGVRNIVLDIVLSIITCGLYGLYWQYKQMQTLNAWLRRDEYSFLLWLLLSIITCGIFALYYEYKMATGINEIQEREGLRVNQDLPILCVLLAVVGVVIVSLAIQQHEINKFYGHTGDF